MRTALKLFFLSLLLINQSTVFSIPLDLTDPDARDSFIKHGYTPNTAMGDLSDQVVSPLTSTPIPPSFDIVNGTKHGFSNRIANENERLYIVSHLKMLALQKSSDVWSDLWNPSASYTHQQQEHCLNAYAVITLYQKLNAGHLLSKGTLSDQTYNDYIAAYAIQAVEETLELKKRTSGLSLSEAATKSRVQGFINMYIVYLNQYIHSPLKHCATIDEFYQSLQPHFKMAPPKSTAPVKSESEQLEEVQNIASRIITNPIIQEWVSLLTPEILSISGGENVKKLIARLDLISVVSPKLLEDAINYYNSKITGDSSQVDKVNVLSDYYQRSFQRGFKNQLVVYIDNKWQTPTMNKAKDALKKWVDIILGTSNSHGSKADFEKFLNSLISINDTQLTALYAKYGDILKTTGKGKECMMHLSDQNERRKIVQELCSAAVTILK